MPEYDWTCQVCDDIVRSADEICSNCECPSIVNTDEIEHRRDVYKKGILYIPQEKRNKLRNKAAQEEKSFFRFVLGTYASFYLPMPYVLLAPLIAIVIFYKSRAFFDIRKSKPKSLNFFWLVLLMGLITRIIEIFIDRNGLIILLTMSVMIGGIIYTRKEWKAPV